MSAWPAVRRTRVTHLLAPQAVAAKIFWVVFWLTGLGAVVPQRRCTSATFVTGARP